MSITVNHQTNDMSATNGSLTIDGSTKQNTLVSSTNIKTVNSVSILGSGDLTLFSTNLTSVQVVTVLPSTPNSTTLYIVTGA